MNIFVDDVRNPKYIESKLGIHYPKSWIICRDFFNFKDKVDRYLSDIKLVSFDHDLQCYDQYGEELSGVDACHYLINKCYDNNVNFPNWYVHTGNNCGRQNIISDILNYLKSVEGKRYDWIYYDSGIINGKIIK